MPRRRPRSGSRWLAQGHAPLLVGVLFGCIAYVLVLLTHPPVLAYVPERGTWVFDVPKGVIGMRYYGVPQLGLIAFAVGWALARMRMFHVRLQQPRIARALGITVLLVVDGSLAYVMIAELSHWAGR